MRDERGGCVKGKMAAMPAPDAGFQVMSGWQWICAVWSVALNDMAIAG